MSIGYWAIYIAAMGLVTLIGTAVIVKFRDTYGYPIMLSILTSLLLINTVMAGRRVTFDLFGWQMILLSGTIVWPFTSQIVDMINEVYGGRKSYVAAAVGYGGRVLLLGVVAIAMQMDPLWKEPAQEVWWLGYFGSLGRVVLAGAISYGLVQFFNIFVFVKAKRKTLPGETTTWKKIKGGFLRSWGGDFFGDLIDSPVFYTIAFAGVLPWPQLTTLMFSAWATKMVVNQMDLPFYILYRLLLPDNIKKEY